MPLEDITAPGDPRIYQIYEVYDGHIMPMPPGKKTSPVVFAGVRLGDLQPLNAWSRYSVGMKCMLPGHVQCSRARSWKFNTNEPIRHSDRVLVKWLLAGRGLKTGQEHMDIVRFPRE